MSHPAVPLQAISALSLIHILNQVTACNNVISAYHTALRWGAMDPDENLPKFIAELESAGINDIIAEKQKQLDEFLASKK